MEKQDEQFQVPEKRKKAGMLPDLTFKDFNGLGGRRERI
jgi:hypothetical protein